MATLELPSRLISWRTLTKTSGPVRPDLLRHVMDGRNPRHRISHPNRLMELELAARPHATGQGDRGQEAAALGVSVRADFRLAVERQEIQPVPERGERRSRSRALRRAVERGRQRRIGGGRHHIRHRFGTADPFSKVHDGISSLRDCSLIDGGDEPSEDQLALSGSSLIPPEFRPRLLSRPLQPVSIISRSVSCRAADGTAGRRRLLRRSGGRFAEHWRPVRIARRPAQVSRRSARTDARA